MSDLDAVTMYRVVVAIEEYDIVNGIEKTPETISTIMAMNADGILEFDQFEEAKTAQTKLSGLKMEVIPDYEG